MSLPGLNMGMLANAARHSPDLGFHYVTNEYRHQVYRSHNQLRNLVSATWLIYTPQTYEQ